MKWCNGTMAQRYNGATVHRCNGAMVRRDDPVNTFFSLFRVTGLLSFPADPADFRRNHSITIFLLLYLLSLVFDLLSFIYFPYLSLMERAFIDNEVFENITLQTTPLAFGDYEVCTFKNCDFSNSDLSDMNFSDCEFSGCNFSLVKLLNTTLRDVRFTNCKILGLHFEECNNLMISFEFTGCMLSVCSFFRLRLKKTRFINSKINDIDFTETDLNHSLFDNCDLHLSVFHNTNLEGADFTNSFNYSIDPEQNRIRKAKFSISGLPGLLGKYEIDFQE